MATSVLIMSSVAGVAAGPMTGPYSIDVALINPGPFATGFNDRMIDDPGEWFDRDAARPEELKFLEGARQRITGNQPDPAEVVRVIADMAEADETQLVNFVPSDMLARMGLDKKH